MSVSYSFLRHRLYVSAVGPDPANPSRLMELDLTGNKTGDWPVESFVAWVSPFEDLFVVYVEEERRFVVKRLGDAKRIAEIPSTWKANGDYRLWWLTPKRFVFHGYLVVGDREYVGAVLEADIENGEVRKLKDLQEDAWFMGYLPGRGFVAEEKLQPNWTIFDRYRLVLYDYEGKAVRELVRNWGGFGGHVIGSPDGRWMAYTEYLLLKSLLTLTERARSVVYDTATGRELHVPVYPSRGIWLSHEEARAAGYRPAHGDAAE